MKSGQIKALSALVLGSVCSTAGAAGFQLLEQNASGIGNAFAGSAADAENASIIYNNPAGMTELQDREFSIGGVGIRPSFKFNNQGSSGVSGAGNGGDAGHWSLVPDAYLAWKLTDKLSLGLGISAPFGLMTSYSAPWTGSAQSNKFSISTYNINPALAYKVNDVVSLGAGVNFQRFDADYQRQLSTVDIPISVAPFGVVGSIPGSTPLEAKLSGEAWGWNVGALFKLSPSTKLGLSYRSQMNYNLTGTLTAPSSSNPITNAALIASTGSIKANITLPDTAVASITHQLNDRWELLGDVQWTGWAKLSSINIIQSSTGATLQTLNTNFRNTWRVALGANYKVNDSWKLKSGIAWDQTPVRSADTRLASLPDNDRYWVSAGVQYKPAKYSTLDLGVAYMFLRNAQINNNQTASAAGLISGTYNDSGLIVGLQYSQAF